MKPCASLLGTSQAEKYSPKMLGILYGIHDSPVRTLVTEDQVARRLAVHDRERAIVPERDALALAIERSIEKRTSLRIMSNRVIASNPRPSENWAAITGKAGAAGILGYALLARIRTPHLRFEFSFRLKPILQVMPRLPSTFYVDFVCSNSDFLEARRIRC